MTMDIGADVTALRRQLDDLQKLSSDTIITCDVASLPSGLKEVIEYIGSTDENKKSVTVGELIGFIDRLVSAAKDGVDGELSPEEFRGRFGEWALQASIESAAHLAQAATVPAASTESEEGKGRAGHVTDASSAVATREGDVYVLTAGKVRIAVDARGGRITALEYGGKNMVAKSKEKPGNFGITFWPSPQSRWGWPPPAAIDSAPYQAEIIDNTIVMKSAVDAKTGICVTKTISIDENGWTKVTYKMTNKSESGETTKVAPWEIARVPKEGFVFFLEGPGGTYRQKKLGEWTPRPLTVERHNQEIWFHAKSGGAHDKLLADGAQGWLAHAAGKTLLIQCFPDLPASVHEEKIKDEEAEVSVYSGPDYVEMEPQGRPMKLWPGESTEWTVHTRVIPLTEEVPASLDQVGRAKLMGLARKFAAQRPRAE